jgi:hypothetical protein
MYHYDINIFATLFSFANLADRCLWEIQPLEGVGIIHSVVLHQVYNLFHSHFSTQCELVHPLSIYSIISFP